MNMLAVVDIIITFSRPKCWVQVELDKLPELLFPHALDYFGEWLKQVLFQETHWLELVKQAYLR